MLIVEKNSTYVHWRPADGVNPLSYGGEIVIVFDPGKTNMAMVIGTPDGTVLNNLEFSGNDRGQLHPPMDTTIYCNEVCEFLRGYLKNARLYCVATEQTILKEGQKYYHSNQVLNEVRANLLAFFWSEYQLKVDEINNWSWKAGVLPEGYRSNKFKGSKKWFLDTEPTSPYCHYFNADMTDCLCIYMYVVNKLCKNYSMICNHVETPVVKFNYTIVPKDFNTGDAVTQVVYNRVFSVWDNIAYYVNRLFHTFSMVVPADKLELSNIYGNCRLFEKNNLWDKEVKVVVARK